MNKEFEKIIEKLEEKHEQYINTYGIVGGNPSAFAVKECIDTVREIAEQYSTKNCSECSRRKFYQIGYAEGKKDSDWIPCNEPPENDRYVLLSFENFSVPMVGRYEEDENGGAFYVGDDDESCVSQDMFVNAWMNLPAPFQQKGEIDE